MTASSESPQSGADADAVSSDGDGKVALARTGSTDQHGVALLGDEAAAGEVADEGLIGRRALELELQGACAEDEFKEYRRVVWTS